MDRPPVKSFRGYADFNESVSILVPIRKPLDVRLDIEIVYQAAVTAVVLVINVH